VTPGQNVKRVFVEDNAIVVELTGGAAGAPASPPPAGAPAPKPGG
jgi:hypothetical protein